MNPQPHAKPSPNKPEDAHDLQLRLYREIGISAVAAALRFVTQPEPAAKQAEEHDLPLFLHGDDMAA